MVKRTLVDREAPPPAAPEQAQRDGMITQIVIPELRKMMKNAYRIRLRECITYSKLQRISQYAKVALL